MRSVFRILAVLFILSATTALADGERIAPMATLEPGSDAQYDHRLPPVYPGEEVRDGDRTIKVWSSSGPVVHQVVVPTPPIPPEPPSLDPAPPRATPSLDSIGILLDRREGGRKGE